MACPNRNLPQYQQLIQEYGEGRALASWVLNGEKIPTIQQAKDLLEPTLFQQPPIDYREALDRIVKGFPALQPAYPGSRTMGNYYTTSKNTKAANGAIADGIRKFIGSNPHLQSVGVYTDPGNRNIIQLVDRSYILRSNITSDGKLRNIKYTESDIRGAYGGTAEDQVKVVLSDPRVLHLFPDGSFSSVGTSFSSYKDRVAFITNSWNTKADSTSFQGVMGKSFKELFDSNNRREPESALGISYYVASRLLQTANSFAARLGYGLYEKGLVGTSYVGIVNNIQETAPFYTDNNRIVINTAAIHGWVNHFDNVEDFIRGTDLALAEEAIHLAARKVATDQEMMAVYNELSEDQRAKVRSVYGDTNLDKEPLAHEYIRMLLQHELFGTTTDIELTKSPTILTIIKKFLQELISIFKKSPTKFSNEVIDRVHKVIRDSEQLFQLSSPSRVMPDQGLTKVLTAFTQSLGGQVSIVPDIVVQGKVIGANAMTDVVNKTIQLADGKITVDTLPEEVAHIWVHWLPKNSLILRDMMADIRKRPIYQQVMGEYSSNEHYQHPDGTVDEDKIAREAIGKLIAGAIVGQYKDIKVKGLLRRLLDWIRNIFKDKSLDSYQQAAQDILAGNTDKLTGINTFKYGLQDILTGKKQGPNDRLINKALDYFRTGQGTVQESREKVSKQETFSEFAARELNYEEGLDILNSIPGLDEEASPYIYLGAGTESKVYYNEKSNKVIKFNNGENYPDWKEYLNNLLIHNEFFPATAYKLLGFVKKGSQEYAVVEQPYFPDKENLPVTTSDIERVLEPLGFEHFGEGEKREYDYMNKYLGIAITDLHDKNVLNYNGQLYFIDTQFHIKDYGVLNSRDLSPEQEANRAGNYYFQLTKEDENLVKAQMRGVTAIQQQVIKDVYLEPHSRIILDATTHTYTDLDIVNPTVYTSVTTAITGNKVLEGYEDNQAWGNDFDGVLQDTIQGKDIRETPSLTPEVREQLIPYLQGVISGLTADGSVALTQVIVADKDSKIAGSIDLLLIDPFGNMKIVDLKTSWSSIKDSGYTRKWNTGEGSLLPPISKAQQHSIQVGVYAKLVELMGYPVYDRRTYHILVDTAEGKVTGFTDQKMLQHPSSENQPLVDLIVPTVYQGKDRLAELRGEPQPVRENQEQKALNAEELQKRIHEGILPTYESWRQYLDNLKHEAGFIPQDETIRKVDDLLTYMEQEYSEHGGYSRIYTKFLTTTQSHLNNIMKYLGDPVNVAKPDYVRGIFLAKKYIDTFKGLFHTEQFATPDQHRLYVSVEQTLRNVNEAIVHAIKENNKQSLSAWSSNPLYTDKTPITLPDGTETTKGQQALEQAVSRNKDISQTTAIMDTIGNSGIPILENKSKEIADARATVQENSHHIIDTVHEAANNLKKVMGIGNVKGLLSADNARRMYDWMMQRDSKGKKNGQIVSQIGTYYKEVQNSVNEPLWHILDGKLQRKEYAEGDNLTPEQLSWNNELTKLKRAKSDFLAPEIVDGDRVTRTVSSTDGTFHELTDDFRAQREGYMKQDPRQHGKWVPKNEKDPAYIAWRAANYDWVQYIGPVMKFNKKTREMEPTGQVERKMDYFIKRKNSRSRMETNDGRLLWDSTYHRIMTGTTELDKAQKVYYQMYVSTMRTQVEKLPAGAMNWFEQGYIPMIGANWVQMLSNKDVKLASVITDQLANFFEVTAYTAQDDRFKGGAPTQSIPIMYMGTLQSQKRVQQIQDEIALWAQKKTSTNLKDWHTHNDELIALLKRESSKMTADQIHPDLTVGLEAFIQMSENFHVMSSIEDKVLAAREQLKTMEFEKRNGSTVLGTESNAFRLYSHVLDTIFYGEQAAHTFTEQAINKIMKVTSAISIPLNIFGMLNNKFVARINNRLDAIGSNFFTHKAYNEAQVDYNTNHIPGYLRTRAEYMADNDYGDKKAGSLYEALTNDFHVVRHLKSNEGRVEFLSRIGGYAGYEAGEWEVQSLVGNAILRSVQMGETKDGILTGKTLSVRDAHTYDPNTGKLELIPGYVYLDKGEIAKDQKKAKHLITNRIHETNDRVHGNYDPANKIMLERNYAGKLILQFHKWVYPNFKQRFQSGKFDENLGGGMDIEGRYRTLLGFIKALHKLGVSTDRWHELTDHQKANLKKDLADAVYICALFAFATIVRSATEGLGDDDPYVKRLRNWLLYQSDRGIQEVSIFVPGFGIIESYQLVQNPFAATGTLKNFAVLLKDMTEYPFQDQEHRYIQRGNFKEESHVYNDFQRLVPLEKELRTWENLATVNSFYLGSNR